MKVGKMSYPGPPPPGYGPRGVPHPKASMVLILGILGVAACGALAPFAWHQGNIALEEVRNSGGLYAEDSSLKAGRILGIIGTVLLAVGIVTIIVALGIEVMNA